jgi:hypothetical protein
MKTFILFFICISVFLGCIDIASNSDPANNNDYQQDTIVNNFDTLERGQIGVWNYLGSAAAVKNDINWKGFPYFFQPVGKPTGVLGLKELRLPDGLLLSNLTFNALPLKQGSYCCTEFDQTMVTYAITRENGCAVKGHYRPTNVNNFNSTFNIVSYDSATTELHLNFDILLKVRESDRIKFPELPEFIHFKNGDVRTKSIR